MNYPYISGLQPPPYRKFDKLFWWLLVLATILVLIGICRAEEEPNWNILTPIIIQIESGGNPNAISEDGCIGLMQVSSAVLEEWQQHQNWLKENADMRHLLFNKEWNIIIGTWYLKRIWNHYLPYYEIPQTIDNLLIAWNWGIGNLRKWYFNKNSKFTLPLETHNFIIKYHKLAGKK